MIPIIITISIVVPLTLLALSVFLFVKKLKCIKVDGHSMSPTLFDGQMLLIKRVRRLKRGDIAIFHGDTKKPHSTPTCKDDLVKRVAATVGDTVRFVRGNNDVMWLELKKKGEDNFVRQREYYTYEPMYRTAKIYPLGEHLIQDKCYYMLGDNRNRCSDSRKFGAVSHLDILGKVILAPKSNSLIEKILHLFC